MKILHVVPSFGLGGMERVLCALINSLPFPCDQEILSLDREVSAKKWIKRDGVRILEFNRPEGNIQFFRALLQVLRRSTPSLLMTYNWGATDAIWLGRLAGSKYIFHSEHGFNVDEAGSTQWKRNVVRNIVYRLTTKNIVVSKDLKTLMECQYGLKSDRIVFIQNGVDTDLYSQDEKDRNRMRKELGLKNHDFVVGFSGRLDPIKNIPLLMEVFAQCLASDRNFKLLIVGDGPEKSVIKEFCERNHIRDRVVIVGQKENVLPFLRTFDTFVLTSYREQLPMGMLEAMSIGLPVVASAVGEIPSVLAGQSAGFLGQVSEGPGSFVPHLLLLRDKKIRSQMGKSARAIVKSHYQEKRMVQRYKEVFEEIGILNGSGNQISAEQNVMLKGF